MSASSVKNKLPVKWGFLDKEEGEKMTTLRTTVVVLLGASVLGASVQGASVPGASVPGASVPGASVPGASVPGASVLGASVLGRLLLYGPSTALQKTVEEFQCEVLHYPKEVSILYQLFREGDRSKTLGFYSALSGEMANFPLFITASCEGYMVCVASVQNNTVIQPTVSERHHLRVVDPVNGAEVVVQSGSVEFYEGKPLSLRCNITKGNHVSYQWLVDGKPLPLSPLPNQTQELFIYRMVPQDSGEYICVATNQLNFTKVYYSRSTAKVIKVRGKRQCLVEKSTLDLKLGLEMHNIMVSVDDERFLGRPCIMVAEDDNEDEEEYMEDEGVVRAARIIDSDQEEVESTDEWLQLQQELKKTLEDEIPEKSF
ncbi:uncharacterized protein LOC115184170 isoform X4 [Salmo trutta]|uniref:uncharacterized protein LOC115184170 isoform X4 n=1 Tax=Salmo trutta TaxID=8032 RepID=UPI001130D324|nr:uncharacterized protein LOC115184170 isoform X4 [Salmo trutta]